MLNEAAESAKKENEAREEPVRTHKRAFSAPDPPSISSHHRGFDPPHNSFQTHASGLYSNQPGSHYSMESSDILHPIPNKDDSIKCMFQEECNLGSVLRKAISHIFGRNKVCTRMIPERVWVHYCRKHYQRTRYNSGQEYVKCQCDLVLLQIRRIDSWSEANKKKGLPGVVQDWTLSMRKREQMRVEEKKSGKRRCVEISDADDNSDAHNYAPPTGTAVPEWLRLKCGDGYTTDDIEAIMLRLQKEIEDEKRTTMPDIEILPNIPSDCTENATPRPQIKRRVTNGRAHKQSQSLDMNTFSSPHLLMKEQSGPSYWRYQNISTLPSANCSHSQSLHGEPYTGYPDWRFDEARNGPMRGPLPIRGPLSRTIDNSVHRPPLFPIPQIQERHTGETCYNTNSTKSSQYGYSEGPLPAPTYQRSTNAPIPTLQEQSVPSPSRPIHRTPNSEFPLPSTQFTFIANGPSFYVPSFSNVEEFELAFPRHHQPTPTPNPPSTPCEHNWTPPNYTYNTPERGHSQYASTSHSTPLPHPSYSYQYNQTPEAINGHPPYTPRAQIPHLVMPESGRAGLPDNQSHYNQTPPAINGQPNHTPRAQIPRLVVPESEQARYLDNQERYYPAPPVINGHSPYTPRAQIPQSTMPGSEHARSLDDQQQYNQASPAINGQLQYAPGAQTPHAEIPESEQSRSFDNPLR